MWGDDYSWIVGLGTDGAAVMTVCCNGLGVKLKQLAIFLSKYTVLLTDLTLLPNRQSKEIDHLEQFKGKINTIYKFC